MPFTFTAENIPLLPADEHLRDQLRELDAETLNAFAIHYGTMILQLSAMRARIDAAFERLGVRNG